MTQQKLYEKYKDRGFVILGSPANNFGGHEAVTSENGKSQVRNQKAGC